MTGCCGSSSRESYDIVVHRGTSLQVGWPIRLADGTPIDVSTWSLRAQARPRASSETVLFSWSRAAGNAVTAPDGHVYLTMTPAQTSALTWRRAVYDVELEDPAGHVTRVSSGLICVQPEVTR